MSPSSTSIEKAIDALKASPGVFQRLIEDYAEISHPQIFSRLAPTGRRSDDVTLKGWPDACCLLPDGRRAILEATHSEDWSRHLKEDVGRVEAFASGTVGAFLFAAWAKAPDLEELRLFRDRLAAKGLPPDRIFFVFREQLVRELSQPRFARQWVNILDLPPFSDPFLPIQEVTHLFSPNGQLHSFVPSRSEYLQGLVHRPILASTIEEQLERSSWAFVRGYGASGKTVLAISIGLGPKYQKRAVYYFDLADADDDKRDEVRALESIATFGDENVLFIADNVHRAPLLARRIFDTWRSLANGSHLLFLGRFVTPKPDHRGRPHPLMDLEAEALQLKVSESDLRGVCRRVLQRHLGAEAVPEPPSQESTTWVRLFGGDMLAFSTAVNSHIRDLIQGRWHLRPEDARDYIRDEYLIGIPPEEIHALTRLAALANLELTATLRSLDSVVPKKALAQGLVLRSKSAFQLNDFNLRLVHPGMGALLQAALPLIDMSKELHKIASSDSWSGSKIATRLRSKGDLEGARSILRSVSESKTWFSRAFDPMNLPSTVTLFKSLGVHLPWKTWKDMSVHLDEFEREIPQTPLSRIKNLLITAAEEESLLPLYDYILLCLRDAKTLEALGCSASRTHFPTLAAFLSFAQNKDDLHFIFLHLATALASPEFLPSLIEYTLTTSLRDIASLLEVTQQAPELGKLHSGLIQALLHPDHQDTLMILTLKSPLGDLPYSLMTLERDPESSKIYDQVIWDIQSDKNLAFIFRRAQTSTLDQLAPFLHFISTVPKLEPLREYFTKNLTQNPANLTRLSHSFMHARLNEIAAFFSLREVATLVVSMVDLDTWNEFRAQDSTMDLVAFPAVTRGLVKLGRPEMGEALARAAILAVPLRQWQRSDVQLLSLTFALRSSSQIDLTALDQFLEAIATPSWLYARYHSANPNVLAGCLFSIWNFLDPGRRERFRTSTLLKEVRRKLLFWPHDDTELLTKVCLLGSAALFGLHLSPKALSWFESSHIRRVLERGRSPRKNPLFSTLHGQLLLGLREIGRARSGLCQIPPEEGEFLLSLLEAAAPSAENLQELNRILTRWLKECQAKGWRLFGDTNPLPE